MESGYTDTPLNFDDLLPYAITDGDTIVSEILRAHKCYFYDACSFRRHANLTPATAKSLLHYLADGKGIVLITRGILMDLFTVMEAYFSSNKWLSDVGSRNDEISCKHDYRYFEKRQ